VPEDATLSSSENQRRRMAACLKACEGIPTRALERGILLRLSAASIHVRRLLLLEVTVVVLILLELVFSLRHII